jgi:hypothetical protein
LLGFDGLASPPSLFRQRQLQLQLRLGFARFFGVSVVDFGYSSVFDTSIITRRWLLLRFGPAWPSYSDFSPWALTAWLHRRLYFGSVNFSSSFGLASLDSSASALWTSATAPSSTHPSSPGVGSSFASAQLLGLQPMARAARLR